jgi:hypothetical protein
VIPLEKPSCLIPANLPNIAGSVNIGAIEYAGDSNLEALRKGES